MAMCGRYAHFSPQRLYSQLFRAADLGMVSLGSNVVPLPSDSGGPQLGLGGCYAGRWEGRGRSPFSPQSRAGRHAEQQPIGAGHAKDGLVSTADEMGY